MLIVALENPLNLTKDYTQYTKRATFKGLRLGVPRELFFDDLDHPEIAETANAAILKIRSLGATIQDHLALPSTSELKDPESLTVVLRHCFL